MRVGQRAKRNTQRQVTIYGYGWLDNPLSQLVPLLSTTAGACDPCKQGHLGMIW